GDEPSERLQEHVLVVVQVEEVLPRCELAPEDFELPVFQPRIHGRQPFRTSRSDERRRHQHTGPGPSSNEHALSDMKKEAGLRDLRLVPLRSVTEVSSAPSASVQFGFFHGASLEDSRAILEGKGRYVRHIYVRSVEEAA